MYTSTAFCNRYDGYGDLCKCKGYAEINSVGNMASPLYPYAPCGQSRGSQTPSR